MSNIKYKVFPLLGRRAKLTDPNKDVNGKGTLERFTESVWGYWDDEFEPVVANIIAVAVAPRSALPEIIPALELAAGNDVLFLAGDDIAWRRRVLQFYRRLCAIKGTVRVYEILFRLIGFYANVVEYPAIYSFDSPVTFDHPDRTWDKGKCQSCTKYSVELTRVAGGSAPLTATEAAAATSIIKFAEPLNAVLLQIIVL